MLDDDLEDDGPFEIRVCGICHGIINEDDPGVAVKDEDGTISFVCTRHSEEVGMLFYESEEHEHDRRR